MRIKPALSMAKLVALCLLLVPYSAVGEEQRTLKDVMQALSTDMQEAAYGIAMRDYEIVARAAQAIADHPQPDAAILKRVVAHLGAAMPNFKAFDQHVHDTALKLKQAASAQDNDAAITHHGEILRGCASCHESFRESVSTLLAN